MCKLLVLANAQLGHQRTKHDRIVTITTLHTSPIRGTAFLNPAEDLQPGRQLTCVSKLNTNITLHLKITLPTPGQITSEFGLLFPQNLLSCQTNLTDGFLAPSTFFSTTFFLKIQKKPLTQKIR